MRDLFTLVKGSHSITMQTFKLIASPCVKKIAARARFDNV